MHQLFVSRGSSLARMLQTATGAVICSVLTLLWPAPQLHAQPLLQESLAACLRNLQRGMSDFCRDGTYSRSLVSSGHEVHFSAATRHSPLAALSPLPMLLICFQSPLAARRLLPAACVVHSFSAASHLSCPSSPATHRSTLARKRCNRF